MSVNFILGQLYFPSEAGLTANPTDYDLLSALIPIKVDPYASVRAGGVGGLHVKLKLATDKSVVPRTSLHLVFIIADSVGLCGLVPQKWTPQLCCHGSARKDKPFVIHRTQVSV